MPDVFSFGPARDEKKTYADGTIVPGRLQTVFKNGIAIGYVEVHLHKNRRGLSFGTTNVAYHPKEA